MLLSRGRFIFLTAAVSVGIFVYLFYQNSKLQMQIVELSNKVEKQIQIAELSNKVEKQTPPRPQVKLSDSVGYEAYKDKVTINSSRLDEAVQMIRNQGKAIQSLQEFRETTVESGVDSGNATASDGVNTGNPTAFSDIDTTDTSIYGEDEYENFLVKTSERIYEKITQEGRSDDMEQIIAEGISELQESGSPELDGVYFDREATCSDYRCVLSADISQTTFSDQNTKNDENFSAHDAYYDFVGKLQEGIDQGFGRATQVSVSRKDDQLVIRIIPRTVGNAESSTNSK